MKDIALRRGISEEQWSELLKQKQDNFLSGQNFAKVGEWDEAIEYLKLAEKVAPHNLDTTLLLGYCYEGKYTASGKSKYFDLAASHYKELIEKAPQNDIAVLALKRLRDRSKQSQPNRLMTWLVPTVMVIMLILVLLWFFAAPTAVHVH